MVTLHRKVGIVYEPSVSAQDIDEKITLAYKHRRNCKKKLANLILEHRTQLANTKEEVGECSTEAYIHSLNNTEACR